MPHHALLSIAAPVLLAIAALGCELKTSDADLQYLEPFEAVELESKPSGALGMSGPPKTVWLDPRTEEKYAAGHVPKSINLPFPASTTNSSSSSAIRISSSASTPTTTT
jgi:hypothetical protein